MNSKEKISSQEIIDLVATKASVSKRAAEEFLKVMIATIEEALLAGETVKVKGFGTFKLQWNAPRKSVNVQTGEDFIIDGYYKVNFAPERLLKELVNEPFAHLESVRLDGEDEPNVDDKKDPIKESVKEPLIQDEQDDVPEPLRIFTEQASEIKDLLSEINALSAVSKLESSEVSDTENFHYEVDTLSIVEDKSEIVETEQDEDDVDEDDVEEDDVEEEDVEEDDVVEDEIVEEEIVEEKEHIHENDSDGGKAESLTIETFVENSTESTIEIENTDSKPETNNAPVFVAPKQHKKRKLWLIPIISLFIIGVLAILYFSILSTTKNENSFITKIEKLNTSFSDLVKNASDWIDLDKKQPTAKIETVIIPKDTATVDTNVTESEDSLQVLFDTARVYPEYIASEQITNGSRLAWMSKKYYGLSDFWVYIYEANMDRFDDPDKIPVGALIRIPKLDPRLIDKSNPRCIEYAKKLHDLYVKR
ncbi:MAG: HU family DNA-binding protein [Paludibacter sp.]|nr:HU family DNA-binding protein [Paludibacter sp.]